MLRLTAALKRTIIFYKSFCFFGSCCRYHMDCNDIYRKKFHKRIEFAMTLFFMVRTFLHHLYILLIKPLLFSGLDSSIQITNDILRVLIYRAFFIFLLILQGFSTFYKLTKIQLISLRSYIIPTLWNL